MNDGVNIGCVTGDSFASFKFASDSVLTLNHRGKIDCRTKILAINITDYKEVFASNRVAKLRYIPSSN